ncbi:unnamed protein product [Paramecium sonneborni]|uniref:Uncharacterized protein n=1 Tax=Paramecium sonneborni TaxID=65129 RepID=A0A8S1QFT2_9CILI|nr:unnamed protein product [Paramecium sonneborni]
MPPFQKNNKSKEFYKTKSFTFFVFFKKRRRLQKTFVHYISYSLINDIQVKIEILNCNYKYFNYFSAQLYWKYVYQLFLDYIKFFKKPLKQLKNISPFIKILAHL